MKTCSNCKREVEVVRSAVRGDKYLKNMCDNCLASLTSGSRHFLREWDKREHARSIVQPFETEFIKAYGADKAREYGWGEDAIRKYS